MISQAYLSFHLVSVCHGHIVHLVTKADDPHIMSIGPGGGNPHPDGNLSLCFFILPVTGDYFPVFAHPGHHMSEFPVSVRTLVEVHEIHIHGVPGNLFIELRMEMQQRLVKRLQSMDPHFGRGESVHPGYHPDAFFTIIGFLESGGYLFL